MRPCKESIFSTVIGLLLCGCAFTQYVPMLAPDISWSVNLGGCNAELAVDSLVTFGEHDYHRISINPWCQWSYEQEFTYLREDTSSKKVYQYWPGFDQEVILYDYGSDIGDTVVLNYLDQEYELVLDSIVNTPSPFLEDYEVEIQPANSRVYFLSEEPGFPPVVWIEGIGSLTGLQTSWLDWFFGSSEEILVCHHNPWHDFLFNPDPGDSECELEDDVSTPQVTDKDIVIFPSKDNQELRIKGQLDGILKIRLVSTTGQIHLEQEYQGQRSLDISRFQSGIYLVQLIGVHLSLCTKFLKL